MKDRSTVSGDTRVSQEGTRSEAKVLVAAVANHLRLFDTYAFLKRKHMGSQVVIAMYHRVSTRQYDWLVETISPERFESQVRYLCQNFEILSLDRLVWDLQKRKSLPRMAAVITFDDGYRDNYVYALPILRKYSVPATFFLTTGHIGLGKLFWWDIVGYLVHYTRATHLKLEALGGYRLESAFDRRRATLVIWDKLRHFPENRKNDLIENLARVSRVDIPADLGRQLILSWEEVREMSRDGAHFGAHSVTHPVLTNLPPEQAKSEICQSKDDIERKVRKEVNFFSYPSGCFNDEIVDIVKQAGFVAAVAADPSWINYKSDLYRLGRIEMTQDANRSAARFCGLWQDLRTVSRRGSK